MPTTKLKLRVQVILADRLKKPLIPLMLERTEWPPPGDMSLSLTHLLYIDFMDPVLQKNWTGDKFEELAAKISHHVSRTASPAECDSNRVPEEPLQKTRKSVFCIIQ